MNDQPEGAGLDTYTFTLIMERVDGQREITDELERAVFEAGCDDALLGMEDERLFLNFDRKAKNIDHAIATAIQDAEKAGLVRVVAVMPPGYVAIEKFNAFLKLRRETSLPELQKAFKRAIPEIIRVST